MNMLRHIPEPCTGEARDAGCTCRLSRVWSNDIDPPEPVINEWCPIHGRDPDWELQKLRDDDSPSRATEKGG